MNYRNLFSILKPMYSILFSLYKLFEKGLNIFTLRVFDVKYSNFPEISGILIIRGSGQFVIGSGVKINSNIVSNPVGLTTKCCFYCLSGAEVKIGNNVGISNSLLFAREKIIIEDNVFIGGGCQILDNDFHSLSRKNRLKVPDLDILAKAILIKDGAFIGASSIILKGVVIGRNSIVAAGSVVTKSIPDDEIWGGNPAKFIKKNKPLAL